MRAGSLSQGLSEKSLLVCGHHRGLLGLPWGEPSPDTVMCVWRAGGACLLPCWVKWVLMRQACMDGSAHMVSMFSEP